MLELNRQLNIIEHTNNSKKIRELKIAIAERYALPFSCLIFALLGSVLGTTTKANVRSNSLGIAAMIVIIYYFTQFLATALATAFVIPVFLGTWFPNLLCLFLAYYVNFYLPQEKSI